MLPSLARLPQRSVLECAGEAEVSGLAALILQENQCLGHAWWKFLML